MSNTEAFTAKLQNKTQKLETLVVFVDENRKVVGRIADKSLLESIRKPLELDFKGKMRETSLLYPSDTAITKRILLIGIGKSQNITAHHIRTLGAACIQSLRAIGVAKNTAVLLPILKGMNAFELGQALSEGAILNQLGFDQFKTERKDEDKIKFQRIHFDILVHDAKELKACSDGITRGQINAEAVNWARHLIMLPGGHLWPDELVKHVQKMIADSPVKSKIHTEYWTIKELAKNGFGGVLGVGQGSINPPRFIVLEYYGAKKTDAPVILVGKGVTFDSGGLSLKPGAAMETMKYDMAGSASVLGAFKIVTDLKLKVNLIVLVPTAENMPSGNAIRPGDVLVMAGGKTVEVLNTDAEGRLILADALYYGTTHYKPKAIIDVATLTGACAMAVGEAAVGVFTNNKKLETQLFKTSGEVHENLWPIPNFDEFYVNLLKSDIADLKNIGGREAGASTASIFLRAFVKNSIPWAHFDIAGCGWYDAPRDFIGTKGASGVPIRLLAKFVENSANQKFN